jgi:hypothetical protein
MSVPMPDDSHEVVISSDVAEQAQRVLGVPLQAGDKVRFQVIDGGRTDDDPTSDDQWPPAWFGSINIGETDLGENARQIIRAELHGS